MSPPAGGPSGRILGVDPGDARVGLAVSDPLGITAQPRGVIELSDARDPEAVLRTAEEARKAGAALILVGLPVNMSGKEGERARRAREFGRALAEASGLPVEFWDERLTTKQAERAMRGCGSRLRKRRLDVMSAQIMLQSYLDRRERKT